MLTKKTATYLGLGIVALAVAAFVMQPKVEPTEINYDHIQDFVFIPSRGAPEVTIVSSFSDEIVGTINLPVQPDRVLVSQGVGSMIFSDTAAKTVSIYSFGTSAVVAAIEIPFFPEALVLSPNGRYAAVADEDIGSVGIVDLVKGTLHATFTGLDRPTKLAFGEDDLLLYVSDSLSNEVKVIDVQESKIINAIGMSIGGSDGGSNMVNAEAISAVTRTPNGRYGLCVSPNGQRVAILNLGEQTEIKSLRLGKDPSRPYGTADGRYMMVANNGDSTVTIVSTDTFDVVATLDGTTDVTAINTGYFESFAFVISGAEKKAVTLDLMDLKNIGEIAFSGTPGPGVVTADGLKMYVALGDTNELAVVSVEEQALIKTISKVGHSPWGATMLQTNNYCH